MSTMIEEQGSGPVLPPSRTRRLFSKEFKADAVALVLEEGRTIASVARALGRGESDRGNWVRQARVNPGARQVLTTATTAPDATPAWTAEHPTNTKPTAVTQLEPHPHYPPHRPTGEAPFLDDISRRQEEKSRLLVWWCPWVPRTLQV